ncbi:MAG: hypothetical protein AB8F34_05170 [Akkermansiaceae bacterium]
MKILFLLQIGFLAALLSSCSSTPASRIQDNPAIYGKLSSKQQMLVRQGRIERGMTKPAVYLAMGHPDTKFAGERNGKSEERWDYDILMPVYTHGFNPYFGYGCGRFGGHGFVGGYFHPSVHYVPRRGSSVFFKSNKVTGWNKIQRNF